MNKSNKRRTVGAFLLLAFVLGSSIAINAPQSKTDTASAWSGTQTSTEGSYYSTVTGSETASALKTKLTDLISSGTSESYDWGRYEAADEAEGQSSKVLLIYSRQIVAKTAHVSGNSGWNREHSFAKSLFNEETPALHDNHHIFADDVKTNGDRGNKPFNELNISLSTTKRSTDGYGNITDNYYTGTYFMPNDLAKGEVARATMYMNTRYGYSVTLNIYSVDLMLKWHLQNPVTNREIFRNNTVHTQQKNRNPFIDHPEYACKIWGDTNNDTKATCSTQQATPSISLNKTTENVNINSTTTLSATVNNSSSSVTWSSNATSIATVNSSGVVTGKAKGTATITASITENSVQYTATCVVSVKDPGDVTGISLDKTNASILVGATTNLTASVSPPDATNNAIQWTTSNNSIASISSTTSKTITVTGVAKGNATITATTTDGGYQASCEVAVTTPSSGETETIKYMFNSATWGATPANWTSNKEGLYSASQGVQIGANQTGANAISPIDFTNITSIIVGYSTNEAKGVGSIKVYSLPTASGTATQIGSTFSVTKPSSGGTTVKNTTNFITGGASINGYIKIEGLCTTNSVYISSISITYDTGTSSEPILTSISIGSNPTNTTYSIGQELDLTGLVVNANYSNAPTDAVTGYTTNPADGATLNTSGTQVVTITYQTKTTSFSVTVSAANVSLISVGLNTTSATLDINGTLSLSPIINPANAYPAPSISWVSSNSSVASVSNGLVTALASGSTTITVTATQSSIIKTATCSITVNAAPFVPTTTYTEGGGTSTTATLVSNVSTLAVGDKIIIAAASEGYVMSTTQNGNNRGSVSATKSGNQITGINAANVQIITLEAGTVANTFAFNVGDGYLCAASSSSNYLRTQSSKDANASFSITVSVSSATVKAQGSYSKNQIKFNTTTNPKIFSCYSSGQADISIYEMDSAGVTEYNYNYLIDVLKGSYCTANLTNLNLIYTRFEAMTSVEKNHFNVVIIVGNNGNNYTGLAAYTNAMIRRSILQNDSSKATIVKEDIDETSSIAIVVIASILGISAIGAYFYYGKKYRY